MAAASDRNAAMNYAIAMPRLAASALMTTDWDPLAMTRRT
jgi:hypothetical protein